MGISKPKDRSGWVAQVWHQGRKVAQKYFPLKSQAKEWYDKQKAKVYEPFLERPEPEAPAAAVTIRALSAKWLTDLKERKRSAHTLRYYRGRVKTHMTPAFGEVLVTELTPQAVEKYFASLRASKLSAVNYNRIRATFRAMFRWAIGQGFVKDDPTAKVPDLPETLEHEPVFYTKAQVRQIIDKSQGQAKLWAQLSFLTGMRPKEIVGAQLEWFDFAGESIRVPNTLSFTSKGRASRSIPLDEELADALRALDRIEGPVLVSKRTKRGYAYQGTAKLWKQAMAASGIKFRPYDARHTFCSWLVKEGVPLPEVQAIMGHKDIKTTMRYIHLAPDYLARARRAISARPQALRVA
jgi:integrase